MEQKKIFNKLSPFMSKNREDLQYTFLAGEYAYATDGHIAARIKTGFCAAEQRWFLSADDKQIPIPAKHGDEGNSIPNIASSQTLTIGA